jgi:hypothetical protein
MSSVDVSSETSTSLPRNSQLAEGELGLVTMCTAGGTGTGAILQRV